MDVVLQEAIPENGVGVARTRGIATFGLPFEEALVFEGTNGRPNLAVSGSPYFQFDTLDYWPDGSVKWALCSAQGGISAGGSTTVTLMPGSGVPGSSLPIADEFSDRIEIDTTTLRATISKTDFRLFDFVEVGTTTLVSAPHSTGIVATGDTGQALSISAGTQVSLEYNGPARCVVRADGSLEDNGSGVIDFTCRIIAERFSNDLVVTFTVRNANATRQVHTEIGSIELAVPIISGARPYADISRHGSLGDYRQQLTVNTNRVYIYQAGSSAEVEGLDGWDYFPHIPKVAFNGSALTENGYRINNGSNVVGPTLKSEFPVHGYLEFSGSGGGVTTAIKDMSRMWPAALQAEHDGTVTAGLFTKENPAGYRFVWKQHESRTAVFSFFDDVVPDPIDAARRLDHSFVGRFVDYQKYDDSGAFPYALVTIAEQNQIYNDLGLGYVLPSQTAGLKSMRYLRAGAGGGANNNPRIEDRLGSKWLRHGSGGDYLNGLDLALYKSEWQVKRTDGVDLSSVTELAANDATFGDVTQFTFSDEDHRYRFGMILAYYLTGDTRFQEALNDDVEDLAQTSFFKNTRSTSQSLRCQALLYEFSGSAALLSQMNARINTWCTTVVNTGGAGSDFGWETATPGTGARGYYLAKDDVNSGTFEVRGFFSAMLAPIALAQAARVLDGSSEGALAQGRLEDITRWARHELFGENPLGEDLIVYTYDPIQSPSACAVSFGDYFHPILFGMAEGYKATLDDDYLCMGIAQVFSNANAGEMDSINTRLDAQHFYSLLISTGVNCSQFATPVIPQCP